MSNVTKREIAATEIMEPMLDGSFREATIDKSHNWRCDGCGLVWEKRWHAETCESRSHRASFEQGPYGVRYVENGRPVGDLKWYTRRAVRREKVEVVA